ncbi:unnamed protein product [Oreochromis niloticus]|nr:unnamed protein product [Mustela putorius furo]
MIQPALDSADSDPVQRELSLQADLLERHEKMLQHISKEQGALLQVVTELRGMWQSPGPAAANVSPQLPSLSVAAACPLPPSPPPPMREHTLPVPEKFSGDLDKCRGFLTQCDLSFRQQTHAYATDGAKIALMVQLMTGRALKWAQAVLRSNPNVSYPDFLTKFRSVFDKSSNPDAAAHRLFSLKQGKRSVADFSVDFWILAEETGWEEKALRGAFLNSLNEGIRRELAAKELPKSLDALINLCISLDDHMREYGGRAEGARRATGSPGGWLSTSSDGGGQGERELEETEEEPMQLGRARFNKPGWRKKRQMGECFACGKKGHFADSCPSRLKDSAHQ